MKTDIITLIKDLVNFKYNHQKNKETFNGA